MFLRKKCQKIFDRGRKEIGLESIGKAAAYIF